MRQQHGDIHGIIHAAGVSGAGVLQLKSPEHIRQVLAPKVQGTDWIPDALLSPTLDFVLLCSSLQADFPALGLTDYAAANAYLNGFAAIHDRRDGPRVIAINWDSWREVGMAATAEWPAALSQIREHILNDAITSAEGIEAFDRILASPQAQILVSTQDLARLQKQESVAHQLQPEKTSISHASHEPHRTSNGDTAGSQDESEAFVIAVWEELLGTPVASSDNFFELGGHSLMGTQLLSRVRERFGVNLPLRSLFEAPTPAQLAERIRVVLWAAHPPAEAPSDSEREEIEF
jgi:acyl carrier protein